jgi:hypothetical protein
LNLGISEGKGAFETVAPTVFAESTALTLSENIYFGLNTPKVLPALAACSWEKRSDNTTHAKVLISNFSKGNFLNRLFVMNRTYPRQGEKL